MPGFVPPGVADRVTVAPPGSWVAMREVNDAAESPGAGAQTILLMDHQHRVLTGERFERIVRCLKTPPAVQEAAQWRLVFDPATQRVVIHSIAIRRAGQTFEQAEVLRLRFLQREENLDRLVLDGRLSVVLLLEDVRVGDVVDVSFTVQTTPRLMRDNFWLLHVVPTNAPLCAFHLSVRFPAKREPKVKTSEDDFSPVFKKYDEECEWQWKLESVRPREVEPNVPAGHIANPWIQASDCASWSAVAAGIGAAWVENFSEPEFIEAANAIAAAATPAERVDRALTMVQDDIRHLSLNSGLGGQIPASPGEVLRRRFGDCKDKAFLAAHLLRRLGIRARPVLVNTAMRQTIDRLLPMPDAFDHVILEYELSGKRRWVDVTVPMQGGGAMGRSLTDFRCGLPIGPGVAGLDRVSAITSISDRLELRESFMIDTAGRPSALKVVVKGIGADAETLRRELHMEGAEAFAQRREQSYRQIFPDIKRVAELEWRDDRARNEFVVAEMFEMRSVVASGPDLQSRVVQYRSNLIQSLLGFSETGARRQPFALRCPCEVEHWIEIESQALEGAPPTTTPVRDVAFRFNCEFNRQFGRIVAHYSLRMLADSVKPERFEQFKRNVHDVWPTTFLHVVLPAGIIMSRRNRAAGNLLPIAAIPPNRDTRKSGEAGANPGDFTLPPEPAPALLANVAASVQAEPVESGSEESAAVTPESAPVKRDAGTRSAAAFSDPGSTAGRPKGKRRRTRSKRGVWGRRLKIILFVLLGIAAIAYVVILNLQKGVPGSH